MLVQNKPAHLSLSGPGGSGRVGLLATNTVQPAGTGLALCGRSTEQVYVHMLIPHVHCRNERCSVTSSNLGGG